MTSNPDDDELRAVPGAGTAVRLPAFASYQIPGYSSTAGTVSIKAQATDSAGDTIDQTIYNAYNLTPGR